MGLTISGGDLGYFASSRFCRRCAWVRLHVKPLPYQGFPGIFSSIDRYNKLVVNSYFERHGSLPSWLGGLGRVEACINPPHWSAYSILDQQSGVTLRGEADAIFRMSDGSYTIVDYKTSRYTPGQRGMFRNYEVQLNSYAYIGERLDFAPVTGLALAYMEPVTDEETASRPEITGGQGFNLGFQAKIVPVEVKPGRLIPPLLDRALEIFEMERRPPGKPGCKDCQAVQALLEGLLDDC